MMLVEDSMTREVVAVGPDMTATKALAICRQRRIRHLPVLENGHLVGLISDRDLRAAVPELGDPERARSIAQDRGR